MRGFALATGMVLVSMGSAMAASSDSLSYDFSLSETGLDFAGQTVSVPQFNKDGYRLTAVTVSATATLKSDLTVTNLGQSTLQVKGLNKSAEIDILPSYTGAATLYVFPVAGAGTTDSTVRPIPSSILTVTSAEHSKTAHYEGHDTESADYAAVADLLAFSGIGNISFTISSFQSTASWVMGGQSEVSSTGSAGVTGTVTYYYAAVPEAATTVLGGMAVMPLLAHRRRTRMAAKQA